MDDNGSGNRTRDLPELGAHACPNCGYCPHCGRGGYVQPWQPLPYQPWYPWQPWVAPIRYGTGDFTVGGVTLS